MLVKLPSRDRIAKWVRDIQADDEEEVGERVREWSPEDLDFVGWVEMLDSDLVEGASLDLWPQADDTGYLDGYLVTVTLQLGTEWPERIRLASAHLDRKTLVGIDVAGEAGLVELLSSVVDEGRNLMQTLTLFVQSVPDAVELGEVL